MYTHMQSLSHMVKNTQDTHRHPPTHSALLLLSLFILRWRRTFPRGHEFAEFVVYHLQRHFYALIILSRMNHEGVTNVLDRDALSAWHLSLSWFYAMQVKRRWDVA